MKRYGVGKRLALGVALAALSASCLGLTFSAARKNGQGGDFYQKGDYENALKKYSEAMTEAPEKPQLYFNIGDVLYRQAKFPEAVKLYEKSAAPGDPGLQAKSWYNIGNAKYRAAGKGGDPNAPKEAAEKGGDPNALKEAAACYVKSLESDPDDMDAKYNLEFVQRALKQQQQDQQDQKQDQKDQQDQKQDQKDQQDQKQDQKEQQKEQEKKKQEKKDQAQKDQQKNQQQKEQEKKDQEKKDQENKGREKKEQEKKDQEKKDQEQKEPEQAKQEEKPAGETAQAEKSEQPDKDLSEQQARQLIESIEREERDPTNFMKAEGSPQPTDVDKDW